MKKLFALLLVLVMVIAIVPAAAAAEVEGTPLRCGRSGNSRRP